MPQPNKNETKDEYISRCIPIVMDEGTAKDNSQAAAICFSKWDEHMKKEVECDTCSRAKEGPFGFPMKDSVAKELDKVINSLDFDCKNYGYKRVVKSVEDLSFALDERADISTITTDTLDRDSDVLLPSGIDWSDWQKTGAPVTFAHQWDELPVGKGLWIKRKQHGWLGKTQYISAPENFKGEWFPDIVWHFIKEGMLKGKSIGFIPTQMREPTREEIQNRPELKNCRYYITKSRVLEYSVVPIPSNPDAILSAVAKMATTGLMNEKILKEFGIDNKKEISSIIKKEISANTRNIKIEQFLAAKKAIEMLDGTTWDFEIKEPMVVEVKDIKADAIKKALIKEMNIIVEPNDMIYKDIRELAITKAIDNEIKNINIADIIREQLELFSGRV